MSSPASPESLQALALECLSSLCKLCSLNSMHDTTIATTGSSFGEMHGLMYETFRFRKWTEETKAKEASFVEALRRNEILNMLIKYSLVKMASIIDPLYLFRSKSQDPLPPTWPKEVAEDIQTASQDIDLEKFYPNHTKLVEMLGDIVTDLSSSRTMFALEMLPPHEPSSMPTAAAVLHAPQKSVEEALDNSERILDEKCGKSKSNSGEGSGCETKKVKPSNKFITKYNIGVIGDGGVGKTALTIQFTLNHFPETYDPTIEDSYRKQDVMDGRPLMVELLDTAGQEEYTQLRDQWIRESEGILLCYSISCRSSFTRIPMFFNQIERVKSGTQLAPAMWESVCNSSTPTVLVGMKSDKVTEREVSTMEGQALASKFNAPFVETSAKNDINIRRAVFTCIRLLRDRRSSERPSQPEPRPSGKKEKACVIM